MSRVLALNSQRQAFDRIPAALDALQQGYLLLDAEWRVLYANAASGRIWGFDADSAVGCDLRAVCPVFVESNGHACCAGVLASGRPARFELRVMGAEVGAGAGVGAAHEVHVAPVPGGVSLLTIDVTQHRHAESTVRELNAELSATLQAIPDLLFEADARGVYLNVWARNPALLARDREALIGRSVAEVLPPEAARVAMAALGEAAEQGTSFGKVMQIDLAEGPHWFELSVARKEGPRGSPPHFMVLSRDITERKLAVSELRKTHNAMQLSDELFRNFFDHSPTGIALAELDGRYIRVNKAMCSLVGYDEHELLQLNWRDITHPDDLKSNEQEREALAAQPAGSFQMEKRYVCKDGRIVWVLMVVSLIRGPDGATRYTLGQMLDIDALKRKEAELLRSREQLRSLAAHQESLIDAERKHIAGEIHDHLGQQLTALRLEVGLLRLQNTGNAAVMTFCKGMSTLIDETIAIVRSVATTLHPVELDLGLSHAVLSLADTFEKRYGIQCEVRCPEPGFSPPRDLAAMIYRVIQESLTNVARHADASHVELVGTVGNGRVEIIIADNGIGFDLKSALEGGTYGLFGMQERVNAIGGELLIDSGMDQGTTITIRLPWEGQ